MIPEAVIYPILDEDDKGKEGWKERALQMHEQCKNDVPFDKRVPEEPEDELLPTCVIPAETQDGTMIDEMLEWMDGAIQTMAVQSSSYNAYDIRSEWNRDLVDKIPACVRELKSRNVDECNLHLKHLHIGFYFEGSVYFGHRCGEGVPDNIVSVCCALCVPSEGGGGGGGGSFITHERRRYIAEEGAVWTFKMNKGNYVYGTPIRGARPLILVEFICESGCEKAQI